MTRARIGDLCVIVNGPANVGRFCTVVGPSPVYESGWWWVRMHGGPAIGQFHDKPGMMALATEGNIQDFRLRPIRDPGDDAVDEMVRPLPVDQTIPA
jgi:hypothetical protein